MQAKRIINLRSEVLDWKSNVGPKVVAAVKKRAADLETEVGHSRAKAEHLKAALRDAKQHYQNFEREAEKT
ncbi:hypothetical protein BHE74_00058464 [Ensete ventricosum]|nr:hypothetical protein BHE74_00058464 [Ensete ventricosum]RZS19980.1 hypothetical protein BHM03_00052484 [Ensete ventricosum]